MSEKNNKRTLWLLGMAGLCMLLYAIVASRVNATTDVILGGSDGAYVHSDSVHFTDTEATETPEPTEDIWPDIDINLPQYSMVNNDRLLSSSYAPDVAQIPNTYMMFDAAALPHLEALVQGLKDAGFTVYIGGAYRSYSYQKERFDGKCYNIACEMGLDKVAEKKDVEVWLLDEYQEAVQKAKLYTMQPGSSEHQLGLAVDLYDKMYYAQVYEDMNQKFYAWLDEHCAEYGFIKRYPTRKLLLTGWDEPWHYRYVGVEAATFIMENNLCVEEFYAHYVPDFEY